MPIHVHESVPKDIKITAHMYRMPLGDMLCLIVGQAKLDYVVVRNDDKPEVQVVPKSELAISGPGVPGGTVSIALPRSDIDSQRRFKEVTGQLLERAITYSPGNSPLVECPKCHRKVPRVPDWKFCPYCGAQLPPPPKAPAGAKSK